MNIGFITNSSLGVPTLQHLLGQQRIRAVGITEEENEYTEYIHKLCAHADTSPTRFTRRGLAAEMKDWIKRHTLDMVLVYSFPWLIPEECLELPPRGFYNAHFAPLPAYRGPEPLFWLIKNQASKGGFRIHEMTNSFDAGRIVYAAELPLTPHDTLGVHMGQLSLAAVGWTDDFLAKLEAGKLTPTVQDVQHAKSWPRPQPQDLIIDWAEQSAAAINALVKASNPHYGGAITFYHGNPVRILEVTVLDGSALPIGIQPGTILNDQTGSILFVACRQLGLLRIDVIKLEEGYFPGIKLLAMGVQVGTTFDSKQAAPLT